LRVVVEAPRGPDRKDFGREAKKTPNPREKKKIRRVCGSEKTSRGIRKFLADLDEDLGFKELQINPVLPPSAASDRSWRADRR